MKQEVIFFLLAITLASILRPSEAAPPEVYCLTYRISRVPGCYDALRLAAGRDYRWLSVDCCRAVYATLPDTCFLTLKPDLALPINVFRVICSNTVPAAA
ncbi:unnamed protein product [Arabidopsis thaliana]|uniref:ECA1 gametogenesis related family protein n=4 Tax=Arabidopsis TaxID=3701 RepID=A8MRV4_ARATH|nr:ECA1 gametogenesis related family protein [Arabidopsis thaliana]KAG7623598.1 hypothetical protein ISN45_At03g000520 [Arabidopsis thaliana x Arabidopsis arenosa]KAG7629609.1 hypothetical protein ISN44_As03g000440 [Arabidopsis suecica]AEE73646.1 ECA1 gametogenesis related family protein [Arabidopsis thaliana]OAP06347.1 hypothetical protein AXX17_AT3G00400 [Arabidopsis thaliana]CAD5321750.1 unnamed protein product [Arabidopsis thaliana]|eukprot:NP_001078085.1 ECA1 gametogenesis related family protein [Arabidopsis thaliana]